MKEENMKISGNCHCGKINYSAEIDPTKVILCHCKDCQIMSGAANRGIVIAIDGSFKMTGEIKDYIKTSADSGNLRTQAFCPNCGTHIYSSSVGAVPQNATRIYNIRLGTISQCNELKPNAEIWCNSRQSWLKAVDGAKQVPKQP